MSIGIVRDWVYPKWNNLHFNTQVEQFQKIKVGEEYSFLIQSEGWQMKLIKK